MDEQIQKALTSASLLEKFTKLPPSHQKEYLDWINSAKKDETKQRRIEKMIEMLQSK